MSDVPVRAHTHTHMQARGLVHGRTCTPFACSCRNHMFYKNPGEGEERRMTSADISISATKDTTALKVSRCAVCTSEIKSRDLSQKLHPASLNAEIMLIWLYWEAHICFSLLKMNNLPFQKQTVESERQSTQAFVGCVFINYTI